MRQERSAEPENFRTAVPGLWWFLPVVATCGIFLALVALRARPGGLPERFGDARGNGPFRLGKKIRNGHFPPDSWFPFLNLGSPQYLHYQSLGAMLTVLLAWAIGVGLRLHADHLAARRLLAALCLRGRPSLRLETRSGHRQPPCSSPSSLASPASVTSKSATSGAATDCGASSGPCGHCRWHGRSHGAGRGATLRCVCRYRRSGHGRFPLPDRLSGFWRSGGVRARPGPRSYWPGSDGAFSSQEARPHSLPGHSCRSSSRVNGPP